MPRSETAHVVYVDDDQNCLSGVGRSLRQRRSDLQLTLIDDPRDALALIANDPPDVVITDMQMPHLSVLDLLRQVRLAQPSVPCMILSGAADLPTALAAINDLQIFRFLTKPCDGDTLSAVIDAALAATDRSNVSADLGTRTELREIRLEAAFDYVSMGLLVVDA